MTSVIGTSAERGALPNTHVHMHIKVFTLRILQEYTRLNNVTRFEVSFQRTYLYLVYTCLQYPLFVRQTIEKWEVIKRLECLIIHDVVKIRPKWRYFYNRSYFYL